MKKEKKRPSKKERAFDTREKEKDNEIDNKDRRIVPLSWWVFGQAEESPTVA